jgi:hypothetical protein
MLRQKYSSKCGMINHSKNDLHHQRFEPRVSRFTSSRTGRLLRISSMRMSFILTWTACTLYVFIILQTADFVTCTVQYRPWTGSINKIWKIRSTRKGGVQWTQAPYDPATRTDFRIKCWILLKPVLGGVDGNLHFPVPSMNRLNQTDLATFSILLCSTFFEGYKIMFKS